MHQTIHAWPEEMSRLCRFSRDGITEGFHTKTETIA
jgi:hypothetical protein